MSSQKEQSPRQDLPNEGTALPSAGTKPEGGPGKPDLPADSMPATRGRKQSKPAVLSQINSVVNAATRIVNTEELSELEYLAALKTEIQDTLYKGSDSDLRRHLAEAKAIRDGRKDFLNKGDELEDREEEWLLKGVIMRQATNMIFAAPKVGKTRFVLAMLSEFLKGRGEFAGMALFPGPEKLLLLGPDQSQRSWCSYLKKTGLVGADNRLPEEVVGMVTAETGFTLDEYWLSKIEEKLREHGPLVVLLDSYSAAIRMRALDENKAEAAVPMQQLHNLCMAYNSTLIVIHHANKAGGDGNLTKAARGSSAITAAVDNLVEMTTWKEQEEPGVKKYELSVSGRAETDGTPLIGYSKHSEAWSSYGSAREAREQMMKDDSYDSLSVQQLQVVDVLVTTYKSNGASMTSKAIVEQIHEKPAKNAYIHMNKTLRALEKKGFIEEVPWRSDAPGRPALCWMPTSWCLVKHVKPEF